MATRTTSRAVQRAAQKRREVIQDLDRTADRLELIVQILEARISPHSPSAPPKESTP